MRIAIWLAAMLASVCVLEAAAAQTSAERNGAEHWVATWATAQQLAPYMVPGPPGRGQAARPASVGDGQNRADSPNAAAPPSRMPQPGQGGRPMPPNVPPAFEDQTVRMVVRNTIGGRKVRIELSNMMTAQALDIGSAHIALHKGQGAIAEGSDRPLTFGGQKSFAIPPGAIIASDPVDLDVAPFSELAVSLYFPHNTGKPSSHDLGLRTGYIAKGDATGAAALADATKMYAFVYLSSVDVMAPAKAYTVVALGDSITDGQATTTDMDRPWAALLARRLNAKKSTQNIAVVNQGISGNQVLHDGLGLSALARMDRDVFSRPGVQWVILLEGVNDINLQGAQDGPNALTAEQLIWGYQQIIARCHMHGIRVMGATVMPEEGVWIVTERTERLRQEVNRWIRTKGNFDAIVDFDAAVRDPEHQSKLKAQFDPGDHIHPNDAGNQAMADAVDISVFER